MRSLTVLVLSASLLAVSCADPSADVPKALVSNSAANTATDAASAVSQPKADPVKGTALPVTPDNSQIEFVGSKVTGSHDGGFKQFTGTIDLVNAKPAESSVFVEIDTASVYTDSDGLTEHLKTADFFEVEKFPKASFRSTKIAPDAAAGADTYSVTGDFTLHGVTRSITFPAVIQVTESEVSVKADFSINRKDFGIVYAGKADDLIRDGVAIKLNLKAPRKV